MSDNGKASDTQRRHVVDEINADPVTRLTGWPKVVTTIGVVGVVTALLAYVVVANVQDGRARTAAANDAHGKVGEMTEAIRGNTAKLDEVARRLGTLNLRLKELAPDERKAELPPE